MKLFVLIAMVMAVAAAQYHDVLNKADRTAHFDCHSLMNAGYFMNGTYRLNLNGTDVFTSCRFTGNNAFTTILYRVDGLQSWDRTYKEFETGFGDPEHGNFIGLQSIFLLTNLFSYTLVVGFEDWDMQEYTAAYQKVVIEGPDNRYKFHTMGQIKGTAGADLFYNNDMDFYTSDKPDHSQCATRLKAGWWYKPQDQHMGCTMALPTGHYYKYQAPIKAQDGIFWASKHGKSYSLKRIGLFLQRLQ